MENDRHLKWLSLANIIVWYCTPLLLIAALYYRVARVLWKTTVISALRLKSNTDHCMTATSSIKLSPQSSYDQCNDVDNTEDRVIVRSGFNNDSVRSHRPNMYRSAFMTSKKKNPSPVPKEEKCKDFIIFT
ncbi:hypothetical protein DPMN_082853 [Dreissena polymorpha]|uniref:Uncharacterized protein n=1 Tax=Dreissena polymorpha TaxID=45954 RepID=A0A9D4BHV1_DREPO|nr:hypothetical protein DPMN_082853 [Dreissena polymorpha]